MKLAGSPAAGAMVHPVAVSGPTLIKVANAVADLPTCTDRLAGNTADSSVTDPPGPTGVKRNARRRPSGRPTPTIWPTSLMALALVSVQPSLAGISVLRSDSVPPRQMTARESGTLAARDQPTMSPDALMPLPRLMTSPGSVP